MSNSVHVKIFSVKYKIIFPPCPQPQQHPKKADHVNVKQKNHPELNQQTQRYSCYLLKKLKILFLS